MFGFLKTFLMPRNGLADPVGMHSGEGDACQVMQAYGTAFSQAMSGDDRQRLLVPSAAEEAPNGRATAEFLASWMEAKLTPFVDDATELEIGRIADEKQTSLAAWLALARAVERVLASPDDRIEAYSAIAAEAAARVARRTSETLGSERPWEVAMEGMRQAASLLDHEPVHRRR